MSDCILREDALLCLTGEFEENKEYSPEELIAMFGKRIRKLPPVTPQPKIGHDAVSREVIEDIKGEIEQFKETSYKCHKKTYDKCLSIIDRHISGKEDKE